MDAEVTELNLVAKGERDPERRTTHRNGYLERRPDTRLGRIPLDVPGCAMEASSRPCSSPGVGAFRARRLDHVGFSYAFLDATHVTFRRAGDLPAIAPCRRSSLRRRLDTGLLRR